MTKRAHAITGIVFTVMFICCLGAIQGWWWGEPEPEPSSPIEQAQTTCYGAVLADLKAPSTAELADIVAYPAENDHWTVTGSVDAQNSFGAMIRTAFECDVYESGGQWHVASIEVD